MSESTEVSFWEQPGIDPFIEWLADPENTGLLHSNKNAFNRKTKDELAAFVFERSGVRWTHGQVSFRVQYAKRKYKAADELLKSLKLDEHTFDGSATRKKMLELCPFYFRFDNSAHPARRKSTSSHYPSLTYRQNLAVVVEAGRDDQSADESLEGSSDEDLDGTGFDLSAGGASWDDGGDDNDYFEEEDFTREDREPYSKRRKLDRAVFDAFDANVKRLKVITDTANIAVRVLDMERTGELERQMKAQDARETEWTALVSERERDLEVRMKSRERVLEETWKRRSLELEEELKRRTQELESRYKRQLDDLLCQRGNFREEQEEFNRKRDSLLMELAVLKAGKKATEP
ncbi:hypothetical protein BGZ72_004801 [Mortierella alpina]|nr:hypothetical protein BGZ72_004801 [Mortierella alpina]